MTALFTLPGQTPLNIGAVVPGAKLYFYQTGTSTPQNTYTTEALSVASSNPVVADANGVFEAIYLDPTLPSYRATLTTSADVLIKQWDGVPSTQGTQQSVRLESTNPHLFLYDTDGTANARKYRIRSAGNAFAIQSSNDAESVFTDIFSIVSGNEVYVGTSRVAIFNQFGSFTGTLTGMGSATTGTIYYQVISDTLGGQSYKLVKLGVDAALTGTSNSTALTLTGLPSICQSQPADKTVPCVLTDNGNSYMSGIATVGNSDTITFRIARTDAVANFSQFSATGFTNSGAKGLSPGWTIMYFASGT